MTISKNSGKSRFLASIPLASLDLDTDTLAKRCKFNFSYFEKQVAGQDFRAWDQKKLADFLEKLREYGREPLSHWKTVKVGKSGTILTLYGSFPKNSEFTPPKHVPHQAVWGRFRLDWAGRLCGFVVPNEYHGKVHSGNYIFDSNTFYVVFLDENHCFYKSGEGK